jgi:tRNA threonylcarbamoyladenosine biosynthesis protein TsaB
MSEELSLAIETTCRAGGLCLGRGGSILRKLDFDASSRHATVLVAKMKQLLDEEGLAPDALEEVYVSAGPGSFTGTRVGVTVVRTLAQSLPRLRCVAVDTLLAVAGTARALPWEHLGVILDAREDTLGAAVFRREVPRGQISIERPMELLTPQAFLAAAPRPILLTGEGLNHHELTGAQVELVEPALRLPRPEAVWEVGRREAREGRFTDPRTLEPVYLRPPEAVRLWQARGMDGG